MSRETDSPSSGPNGRGGTAYPSGTPPYGTPMASDGGADAGRSAAEPDGPKTETTLTTRIRINIPGSRPIPPVVLRTPVADTESAEDTGTHARPGTGGDGRAPGAPQSNGAAEPSADSPGQPGEKTSDWFAPRKSGAPKGGPDGGASNGAGMPGASGPAPAGARPGGPNGTGPAGASPPRVPGGVGSSGSRPGLGVMGAAGNAGGPRAAGSGSGGGTKGAGLGGATGAGPVAPGHGGGTGSFDVSALAAGAAPSSPGTSAYPPAGNPRHQGGPGAAAGAPDGRGEPRRDDLPYFSDNGQGGQVGQGGQPGQNGQKGQGGPNGQGGPAGRNGFGGPGTGFAPQHDFSAQNDFTASNDFGDFGGPNGQNGQNGFGGPGGPGGRGPAGPTGGPVTGDGPVVPPFVGDGSMAPGVSGTGGLSDDTAILTPQKHVPDPGADGYGGYGGSVDNVSSSTLTSGMPVVPTDRNSPFGPGTHADGPLPHTPPKLPEPVSPSVPAAAAAPKGKKAKKKGRSKLTLLFVAVFLIAGGAYGAGLLMNHSDVPKGTTVFGVDIGGGTRDDAVKKLDEAFDKRMTQALKLSVDGKTVELRPDQAGLQFDTQATVRAAAVSDYNPVSVIGSLFGQQRVVEPVMPVDEEKLAAALQRVAGGATSATDGTIKFVSGKAVAVYGKPGKGIDAAAAAESVENAYRSQVESGTSTPVQVPTKAQEPTISNAEVDRMMKKFAIPAMSANVTVRADTATSGLELSPKNSLWKFLQVKAVNGTLVEAYDKEALKELYGGFFSQVLIPRGNGNKTPVTVEDVIGALRPALVSTTDRVGVIDTNPS
ncbi:hypothetical protein [Streptomyces sp. NBC_00280]|uniref:hypothetical protein n=1 Tax=Streptomyces sp. NBC_00280 TaxID=2975699 RepID=UPI0032475AA3